MLQQKSAAVKGKEKPHPVSFLADPLLKKGEGEDKYKRRRRGRLSLSFAGDLLLPSPFLRRGSARNETG